MTSRILRRAIGAVALLAPAAAQAHPGHGIAAHPFVAGLMHPMSGFDHIAFAAIGGLYCLPRERRVAGASILLGVGAIGMAAAAFANIHDNFGIIPLALPAALAALAFVRASTLTTTALVLVSLLYGAAVMVESPLGSDPLQFGGGFVLGSAIVAVLAAGLGAAFKRVFAPRNAAAIRHR